MLHKNSIKIDEFCNIHNEKIKKKISKRNLAKNLRQIVKMDDVTLNLKKDPEIEVTLPCVVGEIDFGNLTFDYNLTENIEEIKYTKDRNDDYDDDDYDTFNNFSIYCNSERWGEEGVVAPHVEYGWPCLGGFRNNLVAHFIICDYLGMANTFKDFIKSMDKSSHYYEAAVQMNCLKCYHCDDLIRPIVYKHTLSKSDEYKLHLCKSCEAIQKAREERRKNI